MKHGNAKFYGGKANKKNILPVGFLLLDWGWWCEIPGRASFLLYECLEGKLGGYQITGQLTSYIAHRRSL